MAFILLIQIVYFLMVTLLFFGAREGVQPDLTVYEYLLIILFPTCTLIPLELFRRVITK